MQIWPAPGIPRYTAYTQTQEKDASKKGPSWSRKPSGFPLDLTIPTKIDHGFSLNVELIRAPSIPTHWAHGVPIRNDPTTIRYPPSTPKVDRTDIPGGKVFVRQGPLIDDPLNDEQWSNDLWSIRQPCSKTAVC